MSNLAAGFECPDCGSIGPHHVQRIEGSKPPTGMVLYCHHDEKIWFVKLGGTREP